jgi:Tfp pilus assembly protein PilF
LGDIFAALKPRRPLTEVGILGLGTGGIATYAEPGERFTFYEIDPAVERIARNTDYFTYLADCRGMTDVILGDARLKLERGPERQFDLLILDVFSSNSVPLHLMTREALELYCSRLRPHGVLAFHISSRYFNLEPVLGRLAADAKPPMAARIWRDDAEVKKRTMSIAGWFPSTWLVMARDPDDLGAIARLAHWLAPKCDAGPAWSDDFSNLVDTMLWRSSGMNLVPERWFTSGRVERAEAHAAIANYMLEAGRIDDAIDQYRRSVELDSDSAAVHYGLAFALAQNGKTEEAADEYASSLLIDPHNAKAHLGLGVAAGKLGKFDEAKLGFRHALEVDPNYVDAYINLGNILLERKELNEALKCYRQGLAVKPDNANLHYGLGQALMLRGNVKPEALDEFRRALQLAERAGNAALTDKIMAAIRRCEAWPWDEGKK